MPWDLTSTYMQVIIALSIACLQTVFRIQYFTRKVVHRGTQTMKPDYRDKEPQIMETKTDDSSDDEWDANKTLRSLHISLTPPNSPQTQSM